MQYLPEIILILLTLRAVSANSSCPADPVEEGQSVTLPCGGTGCSENIWFRWAVSLPGEGERTISNCDETLSCTGDNSYFIVNVGQEGGIQWSNLTIKSVSTTEPFNNAASWTCHHCGRPQPPPCPLQVFVKPENPRCNAEEVKDRDGVLSTITVSCHMDRVFPRARCRFQVSRDDGIAVIDELEQPPPCRMLYNISDGGVLSAGYNRFQVIVGSNFQPDFDKVVPTPAMPPVHLTFPTTALECPGFTFKDEYYKGQHVNCTCSLTDPGKPRGKAVWLKDDTELSSPGLQVSNTFVYDENDPEQTYTCAGVSRIVRPTESPGKVFSPKFAFFEIDTVNLTTRDQNLTVNICCGSPGLMVSCTIAATASYPAPNFVLMVNNVPRGTSSEGQAIGDRYSKTFWFLPQVGGIYHVGCRVENPIFSDLGVNVRKEGITIHSPVQFQESSSIDRVYKTRLGPDSQVTVRADITAFPRPDVFILYRGNADENVTYDNSGITYRATTYYAGVVEVVMRDISAADLTAYTLVMDNGIGEKMAYSFTLEEDTGGSSKPPVPLIVGIIAGVLVLAAVAAVAVWWVRRRRGIDEESGEDDGESGAEDKKTDSDIEAEDNDNDKSIYNNIPKDKVEDVYEEYEEYVDGKSNAKTGVSIKAIRLQTAKQSKSNIKTPKKTKDAKPNSNTKAEKKAKITKETTKPKLKEKMTKEEKAAKKKEKKQTKASTPAPAEGDDTYVNVAAVIAATAAAAEGQVYDQADGSDEEQEYMEVPDKGTLWSSPVFLY